MYFSRCDWGAGFNHFSCIFRGSLLIGTADRRALSLLHIKQLWPLKYFKVRWLLSFYLNNRSKKLNWQVKAKLKKTSKRKALHATLQAKVSPLPYFICKLDLLFAVLFIYFAVLKWHIFQKQYFQIVKGPMRWFQWKPCLHSFSEVFSMNQSQRSPLWAWLTTCLCDFILTRLTLCGWIKAHVLFGLCAAFSGVTPAWYKADAQLKSFLIIRSDKRCAHNAVQKCAHTHIIDFWWLSVICSTSCPKSDWQCPL